MENNEQAALPEAPGPAEVELEVTGYDDLDQEPAPLVKTPRPPIENVLQEAEVFVPFETGEEKGPMSLPLPSDTAARRDEALSNLPNIDYLATKQGLRWVQTLENSKLTLPVDAWGERTVQRPASQWRQSVPSERGPLAAARPRFAEQGAPNVSGEKAVLRIRSLIGLGSIVQIPLWHSGFWITLKAPSDSELLELNRRLSEEKVSMGRETWGLSFSNEVVFYTGWIMDFALNNLYSTTLKPELLGDLRKHISSLDIPIIAWGLACAIWPRGFPYSRSVLNQQADSKIIEEKLAVGKLLFTDTGALTDWQRAHMANRMGSNMTLDSLTRYRSEFTLGQERELALTDTISLTLKVPSMETYINSGYKWINNIISMVDKAFAIPPGDNARNEYIYQQGKASAMRQFGHWVSAIQMEGETVLTEVETIEKALDALSERDDLYETYKKAIVAYSEDATIALIAVPATEEVKVTPLPRHAHLLPLDPLSTFFILLVQRATLIQSRE